MKKLGWLLALCAIFTVYFSDGWNFKAISCADARVEGGAVMLFDRVQDTQPRMVLPLEGCIVVRRGFYATDEKLFTVVNWGGGFPTGIEQVEY